MSVVAVADYRIFTEDETTPDLTVQRRLDRAQARIEEFLGRKLTLGTYTETLKLTNRRSVHPTVTPVASVTLPVGAVCPDGVTVYVGPYFDFLVEYTNYDEAQQVSDAFGDPYGVNLSRFTVTYVGGWDASTLPQSLHDAICMLAIHMKSPAEVAASSVPAGATQVKMGDASVTFATPYGLGATIDTIVPGLSGSISGYKYRY